MTEEEAAQHLEMFVRNKVREGYKGLFPKRRARKNVEKAWNIYQDKGANHDASVAFGGLHKATTFVYLTTEKVLESKKELKLILDGDYSGSHEDLIAEIRKD
jgi:hypothetical protein